jgi:hypothetical protein
MSHENGYRRTVAAFILALFILPTVATTIGGVVVDAVVNWLSLKVLHNVVMFLGLSCRYAKLQPRGHVG